METAQRKFQCLLTMASFIEREGYPPSLFDLAKALNVSRTHVHRLVHGLQWDGFVVKVDGLARTLQLTDLGWAKVRETRGVVFQSDVALS